ncbi:calmodulin-like [Littorina saxatilis]|uniref:calmodulin-like n=1 Tax=Littorina saxatilis TaxID=31220 RepID=UPI0038B48903
MEKRFSRLEVSDGAAKEKVQRRKPRRFTKKHMFSDEKIHEFRDTFHMFDKNGDGMITTEELGQVMISLGQRPTHSELKAFIRAVDTDRSGTIDFDEFVDIFARKVTIDPEAELKQVFCAFDSNNDGFISPDELFNVLSGLGEKINRREAEEMVKEADLNKDGKVDYSEFRAILTSK